MHLAPLHQDVDFNKDRWTARTDWALQGEEWSQFWGSSAAQWYGCLLPRIAPYTPAHSILEIAPGYGRWTQYLHGLARELTVVDLAENCIEHCRRRFDTCDNIRYVVNDGKSLAAIPDRSIDFVFSFDSLVHADISVLEAYLSQLDRILREGGVAFLHHSNARMFAHHFAWSEALPRGRGALHRLGLIDMRHLRNLSVCGDDVLRICKEHALSCRLQERINWGGRRLIDCISVISRARDAEHAVVRIIDNHRFMQEAALTRQLWAKYPE